MNRQQSMIALKTLIRTHAPKLLEMEGDSKWSAGKTIYTFAEHQHKSDYVYMVGTLKNGKISFHMMPLYALPELMEKHKDALAPFSLQKSCIAFKDYESLPESVLIDILTQGTKLYKQKYITIKQA